MHPTAWRILNCSQFTQDHAPMAICRIDVFGNLGELLKRTPQPPTPLFRTYIRARDAIGAITEEHTDGVFEFHDE